MEELNDYLRTFPVQREAVCQTLSYYDLQDLAPWVTATSLIMADPSGSLLDRQALAPLVQSLPGQVTVNDTEQSTYQDGLYAEQ